MRDTTISNAIGVEELEILRKMFSMGKFVTVLEEHEGATQTFIYELPTGHYGLTVGTMPGGDDVSLSVTRWEKEQHHELDKWVWVRV